MENRVKYPTDPTELARRHKITLEAMEKEDIDFLVTAAYDRVFSGVARYLTDIAIPLYAMQFIFCKEGSIVFGHGGEGGHAIPPGAYYSNILEDYSIPYLPSITFRDTWYSTKMAEVIKKHGFKKGGWVGLNYIPAATYKYLQEALPGVEFVDFTDQMDRIKAVKSPWEVNELKKVVKLHDDILSAVPTVLRVGRTEKEVADDIRNIAFAMDCPEANLMAARNPQVPKHNLPYMFGHQTIQKGDCFSLLVELPGPSGFWGEAISTYSMGDPSPLALKAHQDAVDIRDALALRMIPGADPVELKEFVNASYVDKGYMREKRFGTHGQGYDIVDRPIFDQGESMRLKKNMYFALHANCSNDQLSGSICENYLVDGAGGALRLSRLPAEITIIEY